MKSKMKTFIYMIMLAVLLAGCTSEDNKQKDQDGHQYQKELNHRMEKIP